MRRISFVVGCLILIVVSLSLAVSYADIGEVAGPMNFNVSIGSSQSLTLTVVNSGSAPIGYAATPTLTMFPTNSTAPKITVNPANGTIAPRSMLPLNVTVYIPGGKNKPGMVWDGYVSVAELSNTTMVGGATLQAGVLKRLTITAATPKFQPLYVLVAMLAIAGVALVAYYYVMPKMRARRAPKKKATEGAKARVRKRRATHRAGKAKKAAARTRTKRRAGQRKAATRRTATGGARRRRAARRR